MDASVPSVFTASVGDQQTGDAAALTDLLRAKHDAFVAAGTDIADVQVEISPQSQTIWQHLLTVYEAAQRAGFTSVTFTPGR